MIFIKKLGFVMVFFACFFASKELNAQKINQFDKDKKRTGIWRKYYPNKKIRYQGAFKDGKEVGVFKFYDSINSKRPLIVKTFSKTSDSVLVQFYTKKGKLQGKGFLAKRKRIGVWKYYFSNGKLLSEENYKNGKLDGELLNYYPSGKITEKANYKNGLKDGISKKYSDKGILIEEIEYKNGKENGIAKYFELNGKLKEAGSYKQGKRVGKWEYYLKGKPVTEKKKRENEFIYKRKKQK